MHQAASDRWASLSFFSSNSAKRIVHHRDRPETARPSLVRRILFPWMAISLTSELVGGIVQGVQDGDEVFGPSGLYGVLANESVEIFCEGRHGAVLPAAMMLLARGGQFALGQIRRTAAAPTPSADSEKARDSFFVLPAGNESAWGEAAGATGILRRSPRALVEATGGAH